MAIKTIIFDMDGVLFDTESLSRKAWMRLSAERGLGDLSDLEEDCIGRNRADIVLQLKKKFGETFDAEEFLNTSVSIMRECIRRDGLPLKKGVTEILEYLKENAYTIGVASSSSRKTIARYMEASGLEKYFQAIVGGDQVKLSKPKPDIYLKACEAIGKPPREVIAVEDSPNGILSAHAAGMIPVMIPDLVEPDEEITALLRGKFDSLLAFKNALEAGFL